jgi:hypothetical protein
MRHGQEERRRFVWKMCFDHSADLAVDRANSAGTVFADWLLCGASGLRWPFNGGNCVRLDLRDIVVDIFSRSSAQHGQAAEDSSEKQAACGCSGMPCFMLVHGDCSGVTTALKRCAQWHERTRQGVSGPDDSSGARTGDASSCHRCHRDTNLRHAGVPICRNARKNPMES